MSDEAPNAFEAVTRANCDALRERMRHQEESFSDFKSTIDDQLGKLWREQTKTREEIKDVVQTHADADTLAMTEIREQLLSRVPAWALALMTIGASIIGGMGMYILDHLPGVK